MKAATQRRPLDLCSFGLDMQGGLLVLAIAHAPAGPNALIDAIACGFVAHGKACSKHYSFYHHPITCMMICGSACSDMCCSPLKQKKRRRKVKLKMNHYNDHNFRPWRWPWIKKINSEIDSRNIIWKANNQHLNFVNPTADLRDC